jgi:hypothetical protein
MGADDGAIHIVQGPVYVALGISLLLQRGKDLVPS